MKALLVIALICSPIFCIVLIAFVVLLAIDIQKKQKIQTIVVHKNVYIKVPVKVGANEKDNRELTKKEKGELGEKIVKKDIFELDPNKYKSVNNLLVEINGKTHQIDHIIVSKYGIFVIETKNFVGKIQGKTDYLNWYQKINSNYGFAFYNPMRQNEGHVKVVQELTGIPRKQIFPIVCFSDSADISEVVNTGNGIVINECNLTRAIKRFDEEIIFKDINSIVYSLISKDIKDKEVEARHEIELQSKYHKNELNQNDKIDEINKNSVEEIASNDFAREITEDYALICPRCGNKLVRRVGKKTFFWGCSTFPKCWYRKVISKRY